MRLEVNMKQYLALSIAALAAAGCTDTRPVEMSAEAQSRLAAELGDRVAGQPQSCVQMRDLGGNRSFGEGVILFTGTTGGTVYVNRPPEAAPK